MTCLDKITAWTIQSLETKGYRLLSTLEDVQTTAWSTVKRIVTTRRTVYLKIMPPLLSLEPIIIHHLETIAPGHVPVLIDSNHDLNCFLMQDAGNPFWHFKENTSRLALIQTAIEQYRHIQNKASQRVDLFFDIGVPDWRTERLPVLFKQLISQEEILIKDGMSVDEIRKLATCFSQCTALAEQLTAFSIPATLDHCDLHGGNILIQEATHEIAIIDWGETVITHPLFSLITLFNNLITYYAFKEHDIREACFGNLPSQELLLTARKLEPLYSALAFARLMASSDKAKFASSPNCKGRLTKHLRTFATGIERWGQVAP